MDERGASSTDPARDEPNYCLLVLSVQKNVCVLLNHSNLSATELKVEIHRSTVSLSTDGLHSKSIIEQ